MRELLLRLLALVLVILATLLGGCGSTEGRLRDDVRLARTILRHASFTGETEKKRLEFLKDADEDDPPATASADTTPAGGAK